MMAPSKVISTKPTSSKKMLREACCVDALAQHEMTIPMKARHSALKRMRSVNSG